MNDFVGTECYTNVTLFESRRGQNAKRKFNKLGITSVSMFDGSAGHARYVYAWVHRESCRMHVIGVRRDRIARECMSRDMSESVRVEHPC